MSLDTECVYLRGRVLIPLSVVRLPENRPGQRDRDSAGECSLQRGNGPCCCDWDCVMINLIVIYGPFVTFIYIKNYLKFEISALPIT